MLQLRHLAAKHIKFCIGNRENTSLWFDPWLDGVPLASSVHSSLIINSGLGPNASVSHIMRNFTWVLPSSNHNDFIVFRDAFDVNRHCDPTKLDQVLWEDTITIEVKASTIWCSIKQVGAAVPWVNLVWHKFLTPR